MARDRKKRIAYVIEEGDTLRSIAKRVLGSEGQWRQVRELLGNNSGAMTAGQTIRFPREDVNPEFLEKIQRERFMRQEVNQDTAYAAFRRGNRLDRAQLKDERSRNVNEYQNLIDRMANGWEQQRLEALQGVADDWESRGLHSAGGRLSEQTDVAAAEDRSRAEWETQERMTMAEENRRIANELADMRLQNQEQRIAARDRATREWYENERDRLIDGGQPRPNDPERRPRPAARPDAPNQDRRPR